MGYMAIITFLFMTVCALKIHKTNINSFICNYELVNNLNSIKNGFK